MRILLHTCCGPCATYVTRNLRGEGHDVSAYYFNPNIHPYAEYARRFAAARDWAEHVGVELRTEEKWSVAEWMAGVGSNLTSRCHACYHLRLSRTALLAKAESYDAFSTTLLISPYQQHEQLVSAANEVAQSTGVSFFYTDFRPHFRETFALARVLGLYRQNYCGCLLSDYERSLWSKHSQ